MHLPAPSLHSASCLFIAPSLLSFRLFVALLFACNFSPSVCFVCLLVFLDLFVSRPVGRFMTGVAPVKPSSGIKRAKRETGSVTLCGPSSPPALIESSDPKLMRRGAGAHLLSAADVLRRQTGERQWQRWIRSVGSDKPLHTLTHLVISHSMFALSRRHVDCAACCRSDSDVR